MTIKELIDHIKFYPKWIIIKNSAFDTKYLIWGKQKIYMTRPDFEVYDWVIQRKRIQDVNPSLFIEVYVTDEKDIKLLEALMNDEKH